MRQVWLLLLAAILTFVYQAAHESPTVFADPTPSGADPAYPLNHTFDSDIQPTGSPPANADFEASAYQVGTPPTNHDLQAPAQDTGTPPTNHDFETGDFTGWTRSGTTSLQFDGTRGYWAKLQASGTIITDAFTVDSSTQAFAFDMGYLSTSGYSWVKVYALPGPTYATPELIADVYCNGCGYWTRHSINASAYLGDSIKLKFFRYGGDVGIDDVAPQVVFPGYTQTAEVQRQTEVDGNVYAMMNSSGATLTTSAFTVASDAQFARVSVKGLSASADQYKIHVLSGTGYATATLVALGYAQDSWEDIPFNVTVWRGQSIKLKMERVAYWMAFDNFGPQSVDVPGWDVAGAMPIVSGGPSGNYVRTIEDLTSSPFTLSVDVQQLSLKYRVEASLGSFYIDLLRGPTFSDVVILSGPTSADMTWRTLKVGVSTYAGETVKLRLRQYSGWMNFDAAGFPEITVPGWKLVTANSVDIGSDANGTYVTPFEPGGTMYLQSADISPGIIDRPTKVDQKYYAISYEIGYAVGSIARVTWYNYSGQNWVVFMDAADTPTGFRTKYFYVGDFMGTKGYFVVQLTNGGKLYSIGDNAARQALREPFSQKVGYRIDTSTGSFGYDDPDIALEGRMPLSFTRYYNGHSDRFGSLGYRWSHTYDTRLDFAGADVGVVFGSGGEEFFIWSIGNQTFSPADARVHDQLIKNGDGTYTFKTKDNLSYNFTSAGRLTSIVDLDSNTISLAYDANSRLTTVTDPDSRVLALAYDANGKLSTLLDPIRQVSGTAESGSQCGTLGTGNNIDDDGDTKVDDGCPTILYSYDASGDLTTVADGEGGTRTFAYSKHRLVSAVDQRGKTTFTNTFDGVNRVTAQTDPLNNTITINYDTPSKGVTSVVDPLNNTAKFYFDTYHRTTDKMDPLGRVISYVYDSVGNLEKVIDPYLNDWQFGYNSDADLTSVTDPLGNPVSITYNPQHLPTSIVDARGYLTTMTYDSNGNQTSVTDATRQADGAAETGTACGTAGTGNGLDDDSDTKVDDGCPSTKYTYDSAGNMLSMTNALGHTETYTYDGNGNLATKTDALGKVWSYTYDSAGRRTSVTDPLGNRTDYTYDLFGRPLEVKNPLLQRSTYLHDLAGHLLMVEDNLGNRTTWVYDDRGLATSMTGPNRVANGAAEAGTQCGANGTGNGVDDDSDTKVDDGCPSIKYSYDGNRRLTSATGPPDNTVTYGYDQNGRITTITNPGGGVTTFTYDNAGLLTSKTDPLNRMTSYGYDANNRLTSITLPTTGVISYTYDAAGNLLSETSPLSQTTTYSYDELGRRTSMVDPTGTTTWGYDAASQLTSVASPQGTVSYAYNAVGRRTSMTLPGSRTVNYGYDIAHRLTSVTDWLDRTVGFSYNANGMRTGITRPNGVNTSFTYDGASRLTDVTHTGTGGTLRSFTYTLDAAGNRTAVTGPSGTETYTIDALSRITNVTYPNGDAVSYTYNANGDRLTRTVNGVTTDYTYDAAGQLLTEGATNYTYDANGNVITAGTSSFTWDHYNRLTGATIGATSASYTYDGDGVRVSKTVNGVSKSQLWDRMSDLPLLVDDGTNAYLHAGGVQAQIDGAGTPTYLLGDALGSTRGVTDLSGTMTGTADYDVFGAVRQTSGATAAFGFTGEQLDSETGLTYLRARHLNTSVGRFLSADTVQPNAPGTQGFNLYTYVANNPTSWVDPTGHYCAYCAALLAYQLADPFFIIRWIWFCGEIPTDPSDVAWEFFTDYMPPTPISGLIFGACINFVSRALTFPILICALDPECMRVAWDWKEIIESGGSGAPPGPPNPPWSDFLGDPLPGIVLPNPIE